MTEEEAKKVRIPESSRMINDYHTGSDPIIKSESDIMGDSNIRYGKINISSTGEISTGEINIKSIPFLHRDYYTAFMEAQPSSSKMKCKSSINAEMVENKKKEINSNEYMLSEKEKEEVIYQKKDIYINKLNFPDFISRKIVLFTDGINKYSATAAIPQGIVSNGKIIEMSDIKKEELSRLNKPIEDIILCYQSKGKNKFIKESTIKNRMVPYSSDTMELLPNIYPIKIIGSELSGAVFGLKPTKDTLIGGVYTEYTLERGSHRKLSDETYYVTVPYKNRSIKFCLKDIEFIIPTLKGYNFPKNREFIVGSVVRLKKDETRTKLSVTLVQKNKHRKSDNIITVYDPLKNKEFKVYQKDLKLIC